MFKKIGYIIVVVMLTSCATATLAERPLSREAKDALLRERAGSNWQAMIDRNRGKMYDLYDPYFKSRIGKDWFMVQDMPIFYHSYEVVGTDMKGNVAKVQTKIVYSIKHTGLTGREIFKDKTEAIVTDTWLFVDGNWYRQFYDAITDGTFAIY